ncbi:hypothetical protein ACA910_022722 [Epithemia clementina (nom. ined.)]
MTIRHSYQLSPTVKIELIGSPPPTQHQQQQQHEQQQQTQPPSFQNATTTGANSSGATFSTTSTSLQHNFTEGVLSSISVTNFTGQIVIHHTKIAAAATLTNAFSRTARKPSPHTLPAGLASYMTVGNNADGNDAIQDPQEGSVPPTTTQQTTTTSPTMTNLSLGPSASAGTPLSAVAQNRITVLGGRGNLLSSSSPSSFLSRRRMPTTNNDDDMDVLQDPVTNNHGGGDWGFVSTAEYAPQDEILVSGSMDVEGDTTSELSDNEVAGNPQHHNPEEEDDDDDEHEHERRGGMEDDHHHHHHHRHDNDEDDEDDDDDDEEDAPLVRKTSKQRRSPFHTWTKKHPPAVPKTSPARGGGAASAGGPFNRRSNTGHTTKTMKRHNNMNNNVNNNDNDTNTNTNKSTNKVLRNDKKQIDHPVVTGRHHGTTTISLQHLPPSASSSVAAQSQSKLNTTLGQKQQQKQKQQQQRHRYHHHHHHFGGIIRNVMNNNRTKQNIPEEIRLRRRALRSYRPVLSSTSTHAVASLVPPETTTTTTTNEGNAHHAVAVSSGGGSGSSMEKELPPTPLHELCSRSFVTLEELWACYNDNPAAIRIKDSRRRYPLHILADNESLLTASPVGQQTSTVFCNHLMNEFPAAMTSIDSDGFLPFFAILSDWITWAHDQEKLNDDYTARSDLDENKPYCYPGTSSGRRVFFPRVEIWEEVEWCLAMLSTEIDVLGRNAALPTYQQALRSIDTKTTASNRRDGRTTLVESLVQRLPRLMPTLLLVEDDGVDSRMRASETTIFRRLLFCPEVVNMWLIDMLNYGGIPAQRAVDFLWLVSHTTIDDYTGGFGAPLRKDWRNFEASRQGVFNEVSDLKGVIATLVTLRTKEMERAASTPVVWHAMGNKLSRPFVLGLVLIDLALHVTLMFTFRDAAGVKPPLPAKVQRVIVAESIIYIICFHYLVRAVSESWAMWVVSTGAFKSYATDVWNIFGFNAILLTLVTTFLLGHDEKSRNGLDAFIVGLLWIKVLAFLKVVNKDMATFILALSQILYDIRFFLLVLAVCVFMFGDMFHIAVLGEDGGDFCSWKFGAMDDFCSTSWESYLRVYAILLGDITLDHLTATSGLTILFVLFTLFGVIILLNVLIAIISDSYEKATLRGQVLFGRARVMFVAQIEALENFLKPRRRRTDSVEHSTIKRLKCFARWSVLVAILGTALFTEAWLILTVASLLSSYESRELTYCVLTILLAMLLGSALWVVSTFLLDDVFRCLLPQDTEYVYDAVGQFNRAWVRRISCFLFGLDREMVGLVSEFETTEQEWTGRISYMVNIMTDAVSEVKRELKAEISELKSTISFINLEQRVG